MKKIVVFYAIIAVCYIALLVMYLSGPFRFVEFFAFLEDNNLLLDVIRWSGPFTIRFCYRPNDPRYHYGTGATGYVETSDLQTLALILALALTAFVVLHAIAARAREKKNAKRASEEEALYQRFKERMEREKRR